MKYILRFFAVHFLIIIICCSCKKVKIPQEKTHVKIERFNSDSAYQYIEEQVNFGHRYMNTPEHEACKDWLVDKFNSYGLEVQTQEFTAQSYLNEILNGSNIIARHKPEVKERILLCAHYDTRHIAEKDTIDRNLPIDGADDGGSGVGVLIEIARQLKNNPIPMGIDIILFDAEDYGSNEPGQTYTWGLGSQHWSKNLHETPYEVKYGILLDMVGSRGAQFPKEGYSLKTARNEVNKIWKLAQQMGHGKYFVNRPIQSLTDDHRFIIENADIPMLDIINYQENGRFGHYHHTHADNMSIIDKKTLQAVGQVVLATICKESNGDPF